MMPLEIRYLSHKPVRTVITVFSEPLQEQYTTFSQLMEVDMEADSGINCAIHCLL